MALTNSELLQLTWQSIMCLFLVTIFNIANDRSIVLSVVIYEQNKESLPPRLSLTKPAYLTETDLPTNV